MQWVMTGLQLREVHVRQVLRITTAVIVVLATWAGTIFLWFILTSHAPEYQAKGVPTYVLIGGGLLGLAVASFLTRENPRKRPGIQAPSSDGDPHTGMPHSPGDRS